MYILEVDIYTVMDHFNVLCWLCLHMDKGLHNETIQVWKTILRHTVNIEYIDKYKILKIIQRYQTIKVKHDNPNVRTGKK